MQRLGSSRPRVLHRFRNFASRATDLRALLKGPLADQLGISEQALAEKVFPDSRGVAPTQELAAG